MSYRIRKVLVEFVRSTSHVRPAFRWEVPLLKLANPQESLRIHPIPNLSEADVQEFAGPREAYLGLQSTYGELIGRAYIDFRAFEDAFTATAQRDNVGKTIAPPVGDTSADNAKLESLNNMSTITGVGPEIAAALYEAGYRSVEDIARAELDELEAINGIGPATSTVIRDVAKRMVVGMIATGDTGEPATTNPFE